MTACSLPRRDPSQADAEAACDAAGKVLCGTEHWTWACSSRYAPTTPQVPRTYVYGDAFIPKYCNVADGTSPYQVEKTGASNRCQTVADHIHFNGKKTSRKGGTLDQNGNVLEFTSDGFVRGGHWDSPEPESNCRSFRPGATAKEIGFRCRRDETDDQQNPPPDGGQFDPYPDGGFIPIPDASVPTVPNDPAIPTTPVIPKVNTVNDPG